MAEVELPDVEELQEKGENTFTKKVALCTAVFAVFLAICSLGGNNAMKEMLLAQQQASDQWAFYQSKVIRESIYGLEKTRLEAELLERKETMRPDSIKNFQARLNYVSDQAVRYADEKKEIEQKAKELDRERDINRAKDPYFDYGEVMLQIAIVMSSISIVSSSRPNFYVALIAASIGAVFTLNGYLMFFRIPFFH
ncbi:MAG TPA: DUF4337 domain-containing protein [Dissulfurispiraceae bacterium]|nr:DUF4337 domain-containing protein [Dissulfurispiraceae bacterium]